MVVRGILSVSGKSFDGAGLEQLRGRARPRYVIFDACVEARRERSGGVMMRKRTLLLSAMMLCPPHPECAGPTSRSVSFLIIF